MHSFYIVLAIGNAVATSMFAAAYAAKFEHRRNSRAGFDVS